MASLDGSYRGSKSRGNTDMGEWKRIGTFPPTFTSLLPPLFDKHNGCYGNDLIDVAEKPKILKRFWQRRSRVIRNSCKKVALQGLIVTRPHYLFKGQAFQLVQILNLSLWPHLLWSKQRKTYGSPRRRSQFKTFIPWLIQQNTIFSRFGQTKKVRLFLKRNMSVKPTPLDQPRFIFVC